MCGIVGYIGGRQAQPILLDCLTKLEYRGYDSCGIAVRGSGLTVFKDAIRVSALEKVCPAIPGTMGIGHTRWATHGQPCTVNSHPHTDCKGEIAVVHNGVITNYQQLKEQLIREGHRFVSETDTEVLPHLIEKYYDGNIEKALDKALPLVEGSFAIAVLVAGEDRLAVARKDSPLVIGVGDGENLVASDVPALLEYTNRVIYLENGDIGILTSDKIYITQKGSSTERKQHRITWNRADVQKAGYEHFMLKEINEQPRVMRETLEDYWMSNVGMTLNGGVKDLSLFACGTSYHAGLVGKYVIEQLLGIPVRAELASEYNYGNRTMNTDAAIIITQSGETADVLTSMKKLRDAGVRTLVITNVPGSTASRIADQVVYTKAGPEVSVAATKTFLAQLTVLYQLGLSYSTMSHKTCEGLTAELTQLPTRVQMVLDNDGVIASAAEYLSHYESVFFIGRGINYPLALEGALKLKEIAYIHAEGCPAGELKHGPFALLQRDTPVVAIVAPDNTYNAMLTSIKEIKARNSPVIAIIDEGDEVTPGLVDTVLRVPHTSPIFTPVVNAVVLQLLAYYAARVRGCPIDFPRNLAKSVTVE
jgi:glucosamine--fructose-6-phosphate aminotransferase (isomerizing)